MTELNDTSILNRLEQLVSEQAIPFDFTFGRFHMVIHPGKPLRPQLTAALLPHVPRLVAESLTQ